MRKFEHEQEPTLKYKSGKTSMTTTTVLEDWEPATVLCPKCGGKHTAFNTMCVLATFPEQYQYICSDCGHRWTGYEARFLGSLQSWPNLEYEDVTLVGQTGWICPKCGRVFAPHVDYCMNCVPSKVTCIDLGGGSIGGTTLGTGSNTAVNTTQITQSNNLKYESFKQQHGE